MAFDISILSPQARAEYIRIGRWWGSKDTLAQANDTLRALELYGANLSPYGFTIDDTKRLVFVRDALEAAGVGRSLAETSKKVTSRVYLDAMRDGKRARLTARTVLSNVERTLREHDNATCEAALRELGSTLAKTQSAGADDDALARQLELLAESFRHPVIGMEAATRGGMVTLREIEMAIRNLREAAHARNAKPGTPMETERLDLLDGMVVTLARAARKAARIAAVRLSSPAMAKAFELSRLYAVRTKAQGEETSANAPDPAPSTPPDPPACA